MSAEEENNKPLKPKKTLKRKTKVTGLSAIKNENTAPSGLDKKQLVQVEDVIKQAFLRFYDTATVKQHKVKDLEHLTGIVTEYLQAFMVLGYDINGEKVFVMHATNPHDRDALVEHLRTTLLGIINNN